MAVVRMRQDEVDLVISATERRGIRTNSRLVLNEQRVEVSDDETPKRREEANAIQALNT